MARYAAFLRGMNLGNRRISNADLRRHVEALGFAEVGLFRASGNVVLEADDGEPAAAVARRLEDGLGEALGYTVPTFLRTAAEMRALAAAQPFPADVVAACAGKLQVALLGARPSAAARGAALAHATDEDLLAIAGAELFWLPNGGMADSRLDLKAVFAPLGATTIRTKGTIDQIAAKWFAD